MADPESPNIRTLPAFEAIYRRPDEEVTLRQRMRKYVRDTCNRQWWKKSLSQNFPFLRNLRGYKIKDDFPNDLVSGLTVGIMQIPQSMAYAMLASLPPICGLYTALFAPLVYFFLGSSKHISMGCIAVVSLMMGTVLEREIGEPGITTSVPNESPFRDGNYSTEAENMSGNIILQLEDSPFDEIAQQKIEMATAISLVSGLFMVLFGKLKLGIIATFMSEALVAGFTTGAAMHILTSQVKHIFGLKVRRFNGAFKVIHTWIAVFSNITNTNWAAVITSIVCMALLYVVKVQINQRFKSRLRVPIPIELIVVILGLIASHFGEFSDNFGVRVVGTIPAGLPPPRIPDVSRVSNYITDAIMIGIVAFAQSVSMAKILAKKHRYKIDPNQEMVGYGAGSVFASFFSGYITAASVARSSVQDSAGGRTQISTIFSCTIVLIVVVAVGPLFYNLPTCVLASVIIVSLRSLFLQALELKSIWRTSKYDFIIWILTFLSVVILDADYGLVIGILFSLITIVIRTQRTKGVSVGGVADTMVYRDITKYNCIQHTPGVKIIVFNSPVYFANSGEFVASVIKAVGVVPDKVKRARCKRNKQYYKKNKANASTNNKSATDSGIAIENGKMDGGTETEKDDLLTPLGQIDPIHHIIIDCSGINFIDNMGIKAITEVLLLYDEIDVVVRLTKCNEDVIACLRATDFWDLYKNRLYPRMEAAIEEAMSSTTSEEAVC